MNPGTVSLEKFTNRRTPAAIAASSTLNVLMHVVAEDDVRRVVDRLRDRRRVHDDVAAASERVGRARVGEVGLPVVLRLARSRAVPGREGEVGRANVVARLSQSRTERAADLPTRLR